MSPKVIGIALVLLLGLGGLFYSQQVQLQRARAEISHLQQELAATGAMKEENERLAAQLKTATEQAQSNQSELLRLRGQASKLRQAEQENAALKNQRQQLQAQAAQAQTAQVQPAAVHVEPLQLARPITPGEQTQVPANTIDLGSLQLQDGVPVQYDLGDGAVCVITPTALPDGNNRIQLKTSVTDANGTVMQQVSSAIISKPGQQCAISLGDRMVSLAVTIKQ